jgi:hypothetical protein
MSNGNPIIKVGDLTGLSEPASKLIDKVSEAIGGAFGPWQTRRKGQSKKGEKGSVQCFMIQQHPIGIFSVLLIAVAAHETLNGGRRSHV